MYKNQFVELSQSKNSFQKNIAKANEDYDSKQISNIIKRYRELRSVVELTSTRHEGVSGSGEASGREELICTLIDIDRGIRYLSDRQQTVIRMMETGFRYEDISRQLKISVHTVKFHAQQGIYKITTYLNSH